MREAVGALDDIAWFTPGRRETGSVVACGASAEPPGPTDRTPAMTAGFAPRAAEPTAA
jgi:hypothetical protein